MHFHKKRATTGEIIFQVFNTILMLLLLFIALYPLWYILMYSLNDAIDAAKGGLMLYPRMPTMYNYEMLFEDDSIYLAFVITILRTVVGTVTSVFFTAMVSYGLSSRNLIGRKIYLGIGVFTLVFSAGMIPGYFVIKSLGLLDTFWVYIIPSLFSFYNALIFITFFRGLPSSIEESARIDGANEFVVFLKIVMPLSMPVVATIALFNAVGQYNDYFTYVLYISTKPELRTLQNYLYEIIQANSAMAAMHNVPAAMMAASKTSPEALKYAAIVLTSIPIIITYPFLQKYFVKGVMIGSVKG